MAAGLRQGISRRAGVRSVQVVEPSTKSGPANMSSDLNHGHTCQPQRDLQATSSPQSPERTGVCPCTAEIARRCRMRACSQEQIPPTQSFCDELRS